MSEHTPLTEAEWAELEHLVMSQVVERRDERIVALVVRIKADALLTEAEVIARAIHADRCDMGHKEWTGCSDYLGRGCERTARLVLDALTTTRGAVDEETYRGLMDLHQLVQIMAREGRADAALMAQSTEIERRIARFRQRIEAHLLATAAPTTDTGARDE